MKRLSLVIALCLCMSVAAAEEAALIQWSNAYLRIFVTQSVQEMGRFALDTTGGDPSRSDDDNKPLIYGHPTPWTSFTTVQADGEEWIFGGPTTRRAGQGGPTGKMITPPRLLGHEIVTVFERDGIQVEQRIGPGINPYSGYEDSARIRYLLRNTSNAPRNAGLRIVIDTMLGTNDGAPFRLGGEAIDHQTRLSKDHLPDVWQAFDSLSAPSVVAQGIFRGYGVTSPDRVVFADWGTAADHLWEIPVEEAKDFTRAGEDEPDTALVLFWDPLPLSPGATREIVTLYGLGGVTMAPGASFLGMATPSEIVYEKTEHKVYQIMAYVENHTSRIAQNVRVALHLPKGIVFAEGKDAVIKIPRMEPREIRQFLWSVKADGRAYGPAEVTLEVTGDDLTANSLSRPTKIVGPADLQGVFAPWNPPSAWRGEPLRIDAVVRNQGGATARNAWSELSLPSQLRFAVGDSPRQYLGDLSPGEEILVHWWVVPSAQGEAHLKLNAGYLNQSQHLANAEITLPKLALEIKLATAGTLHTGQGFCLEVIGERLPLATGFTMDFRYDPKAFRLIRVAQGRFSMDDSKARWSPGNVVPTQGKIQEIAVKRRTPIDDNKYSLVRIFLVPLRSGEAEVSIDSLRFFSPRSGDIPLEPIIAKLNIEEATP